MTFSLSPPNNVNNLFGNWLSGIAKKRFSADYGESLCNYLGYMECAK
jgi:hypothetical protein